MSEASAQQQPAATEVQQMQQAQQQQQTQQQQSQQNQQMQQPQQIQVMIQQPQGQVDMQQQQQQQQSQSQQQQQQQSQQVAVANGQQTITMQMSSDGSNGGTVQLPHSSAPMATIETSGQMQISNIQPQQQQQGQVQMGNIQTQSQGQVQQQHTMQAQTSSQQQQQAQIQQINDWGHGRVQLIQQAGPQFLQYNAQGQLIMPGTTVLQHPTSGAIQVIAAPNKQFQSQQMLTTAHAHKQVISQGQATSFPGGYTAIPTTTNQTLVIGQLGVISSQPNMKQNEMQQTYTSCATGRTVQQNAQTMQFSPWQFNTSLPQGITWATQQPQTLLTTQNHPIFIRGTPQQDGQPQQVQTPMFIQSPPPQHLQQHHGQTMVQTSGSVMQNIGQMVSGSTTTTIKSQRADIQPKVVGTPNNLGNNRQLSILPSGHTIRPNATISTQTTTGVQHLNQMQKAQLKVRPKTNVRQGFNNIAPHKSDAANQTNQTKSLQSPQQTVNTNKMILTSTGQLVPQIQQQQQQTVQVQHLQQQQQQQQQQQAQQQIKLVSMQSPNHQIVNMQSPQVAYQQQQIIKPNTNVMSMSMNSPQKIQIHQLQQGQAIVSSQPQQQITIIDRPVIPVVSCAPQASTPAQLPVSPQILSSISMPPPIKLDESPKISPAVQTQEPVNISVSETTETTSSVSLPVTSNEDNIRDKGLPKALVKPQVLTHVIEGFVIQEADQPFPVNRSSTLTDISNNEKQNREATKLDDEPPNKKSKSDINNQDKIKCDFCGKCQELQKFKIKKKSKRFCTQECLKMFENNSKNQLDKNGKNGKNWECESNSSAGDSSNTSSSIELPNRMQIDGGDTKTDLAPELAPINPLIWTVKDVRKFIGQLTDSEEIAADFESHEIDGQALMLLKEDHLIRDMSMKLGPALKIFAKLDAMRAENPELQPPATSQ